MLWWELWEVDRIRALAWSSNVGSHAGSWASAEKSISDDLRFCNLLKENEMLSFFRHLITSAVGESVRLTVASCKSVHKLMQGGIASLYIMGVVILTTGLVFCSIVIAVKCWNSWNDVLATTSQNLPLQPHFKTPSLRFKHLKHFVCIVHRAPMVVLAKVRDYWGFGLVRKITGRSQIYIDVLLSTATPCDIHYSKKKKKVFWLNLWHL